MHTFHVSWADVAVPLKAMSTNDNSGVRLGGRREWGREGKGVGVGGDS